MGLFGSEIKCESGIKQIAYAQQSVYNKVSDLNNLEKLKERIPADKVKSFEFDTDSVTIEAGMVGKVCMRIVERDEPKCVKVEAVDSPIPLTLWIQLVPTGDSSCKMKVTVKSNLNPMMKSMVSKYLQEGVERIADALAMIPYE